MYTTLAPAKINLDLRILATRDDGYHELETVFQSVALADALTLIRAHAGFALECAAPGVPTDASNLAWKGAAAVAAAAGRSLDGWRLRLDKHVPAEAGLGGGSADAAAAARLLLRAWNLSWSADRLAEVLAPVGADVAYFAHGGTMRGRGRGERLERLPDVPPTSVVIVRPDFGVATAAAYRWYDEQASPTPVAASAPGGGLSWTACRNDLEPPVAARHPAITEIASELRASGAVLAMMSGSGSAVFGLFDEAAAAERAARPWADRWRTWVTEIVPADAYARLTAVASAPSPGPAQRSGQ